MLTARGQQIAALVVEVEAGEVSPNQSIDVNPETFVNPPVANELLFGTSSGPITPSNVNSGQSLAVTITSIQSGSGSNIQGFFIGANMAYSGLWKFTANIKSGDRGKSTSIVYQGSTSITDAMDKARSWVELLADTFGNAGTVASIDFSQSAASPYVRSIRVADAINPRAGTLIKNPARDVTFCGLGGTAPLLNAADFISTALSLRLTGTTTESVQPPVNTVNQIVYANHALLGIPDAVVVQGDQMDFSPVSGGSPWGNWAGIYIAWITNQTNRMGCLTTRTAENPFKCVNFTRPANKLWQCTTTAPHGYESRDRVRLTKCNAPFFAGSYVIEVIDATTIAFNNGPPSTVAAPTTGVVRRYMDSNGIRLAAFAQFSLPAGQQTSPWNLAVSKRNPGRAPSLVSFRKRPRRAH